MLNIFHQKVFGSCKELQLACGMLLILKVSLFIYLFFSLNYKLFEKENLKIIFFQYCLIKKS